MTRSLTEFKFKRKVVSTIAELVLFLQLMLIKWSNLALTNSFVGATPSRCIDKWILIM